MFMWQLADANGAAVRHVDAREGDLRREAGARQDEDTASRPWRCEDVLLVYVPD